jgi:hypothetical protein
MKIKLGNKTVLIDDDEFFIWLMGEMRKFVKTQNLENNCEVLNDAEGTEKPRLVKVTVDSACDVFSIGPLLKVNPLTYFIFYFPLLEAEAHLHLNIFKDAVHIYVKGKGSEKSGSYDTVVKEFDALYRECWDQPNVPVLYSRTCGDLLRLVKEKPLRFIETTGFSWPQFCAVMAKFMACVVVAEPYRCYLMYPISLMDLYLGKKKPRPLDPITNFKQSATVLVNLQKHYKRSSRSLKRAADCRFRCANISVPYSLAWRTSQQIGSTN